MKRIREVKFKTVLISATDANRISCCMPSCTLFARIFKTIYHDFTTIGISFLEIMEKLRILNPIQNCSISATFRIEKFNMLLQKTNYTWMRRGEII